MKKSYIKILSFLPALLLAGAIFWFSDQPAVISSDQSMDFSITVIRFIEKIRHMNLSSEQTLLYAEQIEIFIRKLAHFSEYMVFSLFVFLPFYIYQKRTSAHFVFTVLICFFYACTDEVHQYFVPGRACRFTDVLIDTSGAVLGVLFLKLLISVLSIYKIHSEKRCRS